MFHVEHALKCVMQLSQIKIIRLRNIVEAHIGLRAGFNLFCGANGEGKTSILEAIYLLTSGKSFRTARQDEAIQFSETSYVLSGVVQSRMQPGNSMRMGVERTKGGRQKIRVNEEAVDNMAELAKILPVQLLNVESYRLLEESSLFRRQFMDWGVFHVEHTFSGLWQRYNRALQQRNVALKAIKGIQKAPVSAISQVQVWEQTLCEMGHRIDELRARYLQTWIPMFSKVLQEILGTKEVEIHYHSGWKKGETLETSLKDAFGKDKALGYTTVGPHRADLSFFIGGVPAKILLSRGQLKLFVCALFLARAEELFIQTGKKCLFMIDDLNAELDNRAARILVERLERLQAQVIITAIEKDPLVHLFADKEHQMFHVEHGVIRKGL